MRYAPPGMCLNDFSVVHRQDGMYELMHLQGPWTNEFDHLRMETSYGRAESTDLINWTPLGCEFGVAQPGRFDDTAVWTMHPFAHDDENVMFYTGVTTRPWIDQSIGLARSDRRDGTGWKRHGSTPVVEADPRWYRTQDKMAWRDPFVVRSDEGDFWVMVICASDATLPVERSGCVAWATSTDLESWEVQPPLMSPGEFDEIECPVLERTNEGWVLLGSIGQRHSIQCWTAPALEGPWTLAGPGWPSGVYAPRIVSDFSGTRLVLHTVPRRVGLTDDGVHCRGMLAQPKKLLTGPGLDPQLVWWTGLDEHLVPDSGMDDVEVDVRVADICVAEDLVISMRKGSNESVPVLRLFGNVLTWGVPGASSLREVELETAPTSLRVLTVGEFVEVYADDALVLASSSYIGFPTIVTAHTAGTTTTVVNRIRARASNRDDASAIWRGPTHVSR